MGRAEQARPIVSSEAAKRMRCSRITVLVAPLVAMATACHTWIPVDASPAPGGTVEVVLTADGTAAVTPVVGPNVGSLRGEVLRANADTATIAVHELTTRDDQPLYVQGITLALARSSASVIRVRRIDRRRTVIATTLAVAGTVALIRTVRFGGGGNLPGGGGGTPTLAPR